MFHVKQTNKNNKKKVSRETLFFLLQHFPHFIHISTLYILTYINNIFIYIKKKYIVDKIYFTKIYTFIQKLSTFYLHKKISLGNT